MGSLVPAALYSAIFQRLAFSMLGMQMLFKHFAYAYVKILVATMLLKIQGRCLGYDCATLSHFLTVGIQSPWGADALQHIKGHHCIWMSFMVTSLSPM